MKSQDDLEQTYKEISIEEPSDRSRHLILEAAQKALDEDNQNFAENKKAEENKVVKGNFSFRKWQGPLSIAATVMITITVVTSLEPWTVTPPPADMAPVETFELTISEPENNLQEEQETATEHKVLEEAAISSKSRMLQPMATKPVPSAQSIDAIPLKNTEINKAEVEVLLKKEKEQRQSLKRTVMKDTQKVLEFNKLDRVESINFWLNIINISIEDNQLDEAKRQIQSLSTQHELDSFTEEQKARFEKLKAELNNKLNQQSTKSN